MKRPKKKIVEGPLGLHVTEDMARSLDGLLKTLPAECRTVKRKASLAETSEVEPREKSDVAWISTDSVDKDGEVVLPGGIDLEEYRRNPIVLYQHDPERPIGKCLWIRPVANGIKAKTLYASRPKDQVEDWLPDQVFALVQQEVLRGRSIGFVPTEMRPPTAEDLKARPAWAKAHNIISKALLFEFSVVSVPCNGDALTESVTKRFRTELAAAGLTPGKKGEAPARPKPTLTKSLAGLDLDIARIVDRVLDNLSRRGQV